MDTGVESPLKGRYEEVPVTSFDGLIQALVQAGDKNWLFRGHRSVGWSLSTSFERALDSFDLPRSSWSRLEAGLLRAFQRRAHHYLRDVPEKNKWLEWFALMRHHGAPTRLLDWTYSYYVAAFFALEHAVQSCAVWGLDVAWVGERIRARGLVPGDAQDRFDVDKNMEEAKTFKEILARPPGERKRYVFAVNPFRLNERLSVQQGAFVCPGDVSATFEENLAALFEGERIPSDRLKKFVFTFDRKERQSAVARLSRMNISSTSLYPGLDGYGRSLELALARPEILDPSSDYPFYSS